MKRAAVAILLAALLSACVAVTVERRSPRKGPIKEVGYIEFGGGEVRYSAEGWDWIVASRRKTALKLMGRNCGSDLAPEIVDEFPRQDADAAYNGEDIEASMKIGGEHYHIERYIHIVYKCRPKGAAATAVSTSTARGPSLVIPGVTLSTAAVVASTAPANVPATSSSTLAAPEPPR